MSVEILRLDNSHLHGERDRAFSERWLRPPGQDQVRSVAITFTNLDRGIREHGKEFGSTKFAVSFSPGSQKLQILSARFDGLTSRIKNAGYALG